MRPEAGDGIADPGGSRPISLSNTLHTLVAKGLNATLENLASRLVHPSQRGFVEGRSMHENIVRTLAPVHRSLRYPQSDIAVVLFDIAAAFPSPGWGSIWAVMAGMRIPAWLISSLRALCEGSTAQIVFGGILTDAGFDIARGIKQGCPSSGSVWAMVFDPVVRLLRAQLRGPLDEISVCADDIAATLARLACSMFWRWLQGWPSTLRRHWLSTTAPGET